MKNKSLYVAFSNQKGGVGKSAFTVLLASHVHYTLGKNVLVVDCDYPQFSIQAMRERDKKVVGKTDYYKQLMVEQFEKVKRKAYTVITSNPAEAKEAADDFIESQKAEIDIVFFDLPGTVNAKGVFKSLVNMDYIFTPIVPDRMAMQSSLAFASTLHDFIKSEEKVPLKELYLFWNMVDNRVSKDIFNFYNTIIERLGIHLLETIMPFTHRYGKELSTNGKPFFRSTLFPANGSAMQGSNLDLLENEICSILKI